MIARAPPAELAAAASAASGNGRRIAAALAAGGPGWFALTVGQAAVCFQNLVLPEGIPRKHGADSSWGIDQFE
jgi:hypothetical protein